MPINELEQHPCLDYQKGSSIIMKEEEFYKRKIFFGENISNLRRLDSNVDIWWKSNRYREISKKKGKFEQKLKEQGLSFSPDELYKLYEWWMKTPKNCHYCDIKEDELELLRSIDGHINKRYPTRGKVLEIDRKDSAKGYNISDNLVLACYWCNNAKTDTFTYEEFLPMGVIIKEIWAKRFNYKLLKGEDI